MTYPSFSSGDVFYASDANAIGLWLVKSQAVGTGVSNVVITNAFSSSYDDYLITYSGGTMSADTNITMFLGTTTPASGYYLSMIFGNTSGSPLIAGNNNSAAWSWAGGGSSNGANMYVVLKNPFLTKETMMTAEIRYSTVFGHSVAYHANTSSWTDFVCAPASGTFSGGTIRVYGYRN